MRDPTNLDITNVLYTRLVVPITELVAKLIRRFFEDDDATNYLVQLATVDPAYVSGNPKVKFDRDSAMSGKTYEYSKCLTLAANDRVIMQRVGHSWVVIGKL